MHFGNSLVLAKSNQRTSDMWLFSVRAFFSILFHKAHLSGVSRLWLLSEQLFPYYKWISQPLSVLPLASCLVQGLRSFLPGH